MGSGSFGAQRKTLERDSRPRRLSFLSRIANQFSPYRSLIDTSNSHGTFPSQGLKPTNPQVLFYFRLGLVPASMKMGLASLASVFSMERAAAIGVEEIVKWPSLAVGRLMPSKSRSLLQVGKRQMMLWEWIFMPGFWYTLSEIGIDSFGLNAIEHAPIWDRGWRNGGELDGASVRKGLIRIQSQVWARFFGLNSGSRLRLGLWNAETGPIWALVFGSKLDLFCEVAVGVVMGAGET